MVNIPFLLFISLLQLNKLEWSLYDGQLLTDINPGEVEKEK